jgi:hypothetical protein
VGNMKREGGREIGWGDIEMEGERERQVKKVCKSESVIYEESE